MKKLILLFVTIIPLITKSQIIAGIAPIGTHIEYPNDSIAVTITGEKDSIEIDLDCDSQLDLTLYLKKGAFAIDIPNRINAASNDTSINLCFDTSPSLPNSYISWYNQGDTMVCPNGYTWNIPDINNYSLIASSGGLDASGPPFGTDTFIAVRKNIGGIYKQGWINLTFDIYNGANPYLILNSYSAFCAPNGLNNHEVVNLFQVYPTFFNQDLKISSIENNFQIQILNHLGILIFDSYYEKSGSHLISLNQISNGIYFIRYISKKGNQVVKIHKNN